MVVIGVDPGSHVTGYGLIEKRDSTMNCIRYGHISPPQTLSFYERIHHIHQAMVEIFSSHSPQELAIEDMFHAKNVQSTLKLGHARGAVLIAAVHCGLSIFEYSPREIKKAVAGYGQATKEQVRSMVQRILKLREPPALDTSDALATAICHLNWIRFDAAHKGRPGI